jgi:hypothetical protein
MDHQRALKSSNVNNSPKSKSISMIQLPFCSQLNTFSNNQDAPAELHLDTLVQALTAMVNDAPTRNL